MNNHEPKQKNKISTGLIITKDQLHASIFPDEVKEEITEVPYYLLIFISREDVIKISCFPTKTNLIKKILIKLEEFSPDIVRGIAEVLDNLKLSQDILHTTGICYELENCFYETYLIGDKLETKELNIDKIYQKFLEIPRVINVSVEDISLMY
jgi:hypothetical protein